jgi:DNA topoisomerase-2
LRKRGYAAFPNADGRRKADTEVSDEESEEESGDRSADHGYNYLLSMPIWSLTYEKVIIKRASFMLYIHANNPV